MTKPLAVGKLPAALLQQCLQYLPRPSPQVLVPPGLGADAAGIAPAKPLLAVTTDPITFSSDQIAMTSIAVNANDVACLGARPRYYTGTLLLPVGSTEATVIHLFQQLGQALSQYQIDGIGGHVEITPSVNQVILVGQMVGEAIGDSLLSPQAIEPFDHILLWQSAGLEGTAILAHELQALLATRFKPAELAAMQQLLQDPGICIWPFVQRLLPNGDIVALHDPTEGGIATALHELADASGCGLRVDGQAIAFLPSTLQLCQHLKLNPYGLLSSGALLIVCRPQASVKLLAQYQGLPLKWVGEFTQASARCMLTSAGKQALPRFDQDEITRVLK